MRVWRLCNKRHAATAFDGEGARRHGGRWNPKGVAAVYTSSTKSLAALEILVHVDVAQAPINYVAIPADIPASVAIETVDIDDLDDDWQFSWESELAKVGAKWIADAKTAILAVPSAIIPDELNYILNPLHGDFAKIQVGKSAPFALDLRLLEKPRGKRK